MASRSWNRVELIGNLTRDPELRYTPNGAAVCTFGLATNRTFVTEGEKKEEVDFHRLVAWNKLAELCSQLLKKGTKVFISGRLQTRSWEGQDGAQRQTTEIVVEDMILLSPKGSSEGVSIGEDIDIDSLPVTPSPKPAPEAPVEEVVPPPAEEAVTPEPEAPKKPDENIDADTDLPF
jgi:single-strand DNA-binding protein